MSKHSMRRGSVGSSQGRLQRLERVVVAPSHPRRSACDSASAALRCASSTMPFLSPRCGTTMRTLRPALLREPVFEHVLLGRLHRHVNLRRRVVVGIELLHRRFDRRSASVWRRLALRIAGSATRTRSMTRPPRNDEHLHDRALGAELHAEHIAIAELRRRHLLLPLAHRLHRAHRIAQLRRLFEPLVLRRPRSCAPRSWSASSSLRPSRNSRVSATATA